MLAPRTFPLSRIAGLLLILVLPGFTHSAQAAICYVAPNANGSGLSWASPAALQGALNSPTCDEIRMKTGTYTRSGGFSIQGPGAKKLQGGWFQMPPPVSAWIQTTLPEQTIISGEGQRRALLLDASSGNIQPGTHSFDTLAFVDGHSDGNGGGILCLGEDGADCSPLFKNVVFRDNHAETGGGAFYARGKNGESSPKFEQVLFVENHADERGGAIYLNASDGGISSPVFKQTEFIGNTAGTGTDGRGGAIYTLAQGAGSRVEPTFTDVKFSFNSSRRDGGAIFNLIDGTGAQNNSLFSRASFTANSATNYAGAMFTWAIAGGFSSLHHENVTFVDNSSVSSGGAVMNHSRSASQIQSKYLFTTFARNHSQSSVGAMYNYAESVESNVTATLANTLVWDNQATAATQLAHGGIGTRMSFISHSLIHGSGGSGTSYWDPSGTGNGHIDQGNNIDADPLLDYRSFNNGGHVDTVAFRSTASAAFNAASPLSCPSRDARSLSRPSLGGCDIGAFEFRNSDVVDIFKDGFEP